MTVCARSGCGRKIAASTVGSGFDRPVWVHVGDDGGADLIPRHNARPVVCPALTAVGPARVVAGCTREDGHPGLHRSQVRGRGLVEWP